VKDAAKGIVAAIEHYDDMPSVVNLATGQEVSIKTIVNMICKAAGFTGKVSYDSLKPDGQPRRCVDITRAIKYLKWHPIMPLKDGVAEMVKKYAYPN
jgi:nucleoside-diphosphate-sugar epimerase